MSLNLPKSVPMKYRPRMQHWDDERSNGNSLIVSLNAGWRFPVAEGHVQGFDAVHDAIEGLRESEPCCCVDCKKVKNQ